MHTYMKMDKDMRKMAKNKHFKHDFGDGKGPVPAYYHMNKMDTTKRGRRGGVVACTAFVGEEAYVDESAQIYGHACVEDHAEVLENVRVYGYSIVNEYACLMGRARVGGNAHIHGRAVISGNCVLLGGKYGGHLFLHKNAMLTSDALTITREGGFVFMYAPNHNNYIHTRSSPDPSSKMAKELVVAKELVSGEDGGHIDDEHVKYEGSGQWYVHAGCRTFTMPEARKHWTRYKNSKIDFEKRVKYKQTMLILDTLETWRKSKYGTKP